MHVEPHHTGEGLESLAAEQPRVARWRRLRAVYLAHEGRTAEAISDARAAPLEPSRSGSPATTVAASPPWPIGPAGAASPG